MVLPVALIELPPTPSRVVQLQSCRSRADFIERLRAHALTLADGQWIIGGDWDHENWGELNPAFPTRFEIDAVTPRNPVWITRHEGHQYLANTLALELAGWSDPAAIPDVSGGTVLRDAAGVPTGLFRDNALDLVYPRVPAPDQAESDAALAAAQALAFSNGVTGIHHMTEPATRNRGGLAVDLDVFASAEARGLLKIRTYVAVPIQDWAQMAARKAAERAAGAAAAAARPPLLRYGAIKGYVDGSLGSHSAAFFEPYLDNDCYKRCKHYAGDCVNSEEDLLAWISGLDAAGLQVFIHAIGDRAIHIILDVFAKVAALNGPRDRRWRIEHSQHIAPADIPRYKELGVVASCQPQHAVDDGRWCERLLGSGRLKGTYAFRTLLDSGAHVAFGSDWFVSPPCPLEGIDAAVRRRTLPSGGAGAPVDDSFVFMPEECITAEEALRAYTVWAAHAGFAEQDQGSIETGKVRCWLCAS